MTRIGIVVGSLRKSSFNRTLASRSIDILEDLGVEAVEIKFDALPFFNEDDEFPVRSEVASVREQVAAVDALWLFTPQYNNSTTAYLKNFLDWMSRRDTPEAPREDAVLAGKPLTVSGISGLAAIQGARAEVVRVAKHIGCKVMEENSAGLVLPASAWSDGVYEPSVGDLAAVHAQAKAFLDFIA